MNKKSKKTRKVGSYCHAFGRGWYRMYRTWQDHPVFGEEPFSARDAWTWLIEQAVYSDEGRMISITGCEAMIMRGQLSHSLRYIANAWGWDDSRVNRLLKRWERTGMIALNSERGQNIITICNYEKYQGVVDEEDRQSRQERNRGETKNNKSNNAKK